MTGARTIVNLYSSCLGVNIFSHFSMFYFIFSLKVNKSAYIAKSRQHYHLTLSNILLHVSNHFLKDMYMLNYGTF